VNRGGGINELTTVVHGGDLVIWKPDFRSGIKKITEVYSKTKEGNVFRSEPKRTRRAFLLRIPKDAVGEEAYGIKYITCDGKELHIDPVLKVKPPPED
jgi:hypothetical protein